MSSSHSNLVNNLYEGLHNYKCTNCKFCLNYISTKDNQLIFKCIERSKSHKNYFSKDLIKRFENTYEFFDSDINKSILLLGKGVYSYEYTDRWERFNEKLLLNKKDFYSNLNMEDITDVDLRHVKRVFNKNFDNKNLGDYHDLHVQSATLLLADVFKNFINKCIEIFKLDPAHFYQHLD